MVGDGVNVLGHYSPLLTLGFLVANLSLLLPSSPLLGLFVYSLGPRVSVALPH